MHNPNLEPQDVLTLALLEDRLLGYHPAESVPVSAGELAVVLEMVHLVDDAWKELYDEVVYLQGEVLRLECVVDELE